VLEAPKVFKYIIAFACFSALASADTITTTLTGVGSYTPGAPVTYTETVTYDPALPFNYGDISDGGGSGTVGTFSLSFPQIVAQAGYVITDAKLSLLVYPNWSMSPLQLVSLAPLTTGQAYSQGYPGSHYFDAVTTCSAVCSYTALPQPTSPPVGGILFTADLGVPSGALAPITGGFSFFYGFMTAQSSNGGVNDVSVFQQTFSAPTAYLSETLALTETATPEPATLLLMLAACACVSALRPGRRPMTFR
jgi:hypothetical protein